MSKNKDPAVLFYTGDFLADTTLWTYEELGMYIKLLCLQHLNGGIKECDLLQVCGDKERVLEKFDLLEDGLYYNDRMLEETNSRANFIQSRYENGSKGGRPKKPTQNHMVSSRLTYTKPRQNLGENENENINISEDLIVQSNNISTNLEDEPQSASNAPQNEGQAPRLAPLEERFSRFWEAYPRKRAKDDAKRRWMSLKPSEALLEVMLAAIEEQKNSAEWKKEDGKFIPYPATWLNRGQWNDELSEQKESAPSVPKYSNFNAEDALEKAIERSSTPITIPVSDDELFADALRRTYGG